MTYFGPSSYCIFTASSICHQPPPNTVKTVNTGHIRFVMRDKEGEDWT